MRDRRAAPRLPVNISGSAVMSSFSAKCTIEEISETGARLRFTHALVLPLKFLLRFSDDYEEIATMVWRRGDVVGVSFARPIPMQEYRRASLAKAYA